MPRVIVFDVNETLLDLGALDNVFQQIFGDASVRRLWFSQVLQSSMVAALTGRYNTFAEIGAASLEMVAGRRGVRLSEQQRQDVMAGMRSLPPHPEVKGALERIKSAGLRMATLTNSPPAVVQAQLSNAGLAQYFEKMVSVDAVRTFKPAAIVYEQAGKELGVGVAQIRLVAAHDWDIAGALAAGCAAAFIARPGMVLSPLAARPDIMGKDLIEVADRIIAVEKSG